MEKWRNNSRSWGCPVALLTDLSKAFNCILHDLIIVKLEAYGFQMDTLKLVYDYLSNRKQRVKQFSSWKDVEYVVSQGPLLFNIILVTYFPSLKIRILQAMRMIPYKSPYKCIRGIITATF